MTARVFVPYVTYKRGVDGSLAPVHDLSDLHKFGDLVEVFDRPVAAGRQTEGMRQKVFGAMQGFCDDDHIVALGDPAAIAIVAMVGMTLNGGRVSLLRWDRQSRTYEQLKIDLEGKTYGQEANAR